jgi:hypothetical protein
VSGVWASNTYTVSGTIAPSAADGTYGYRVSTTGHNAPCAAATASGSITVKPCNGGYDCEVWTTCGFTLITLGENRLPWQSASNYCTNKGGGGWRLPTSSELQCMQSNRGSLPGGCSGDTGYWSSASCSSGHVSRAVCMSNYSEACTTNATQLRTRCVR